MVRFGVIAGLCWGGCVWFVAGWCGLVTGRATPRVGASHLLLWAQFEKLDVRFAFLIA